MTPGARAFAWLALSALALFGCAVPEPAGFRNPEAPIGATTRFDAAAFSGSWVLAESFTPLPRAEVLVSQDTDASRLRISGSEVPELEGNYRQGTPGELIPVSGAAEPLVVMWVDEQFRTAVIGTVSGSFGAVLDRTGDIPPDREKAAREIFSFYGWDVSRLKRTLQ
jgi:apolipoprotein D and lipocalin family protein